jgi:hypothetical protein
MWYMHLPWVAPAAVRAVLNSLPGDACDVIEAESNFIGWKATLREGET